MKSLEKYVLPQSEYYVHYSSELGKNTFFYPIHIGHFYYDAGYSQSRSAFDSFLLMYLLSGEAVLQYGGNTISIRKNQFVFLDCYRPHAYYSERPYEALWMHFDGQNSRQFYELITGNIGSVFTMDDPLPIISRISGVYEVFHQGQPIREAYLSREIYDMLCELCLFSTAKTRAVQHSPEIERVMAYINEHFKENPSTKELSEIACLSPYYFIRFFRKETGLTPHEYILNLKMRTAKYLLRKTLLSVKDICFESGFGSESVFCAAFKKMTGESPSVYRRKRSEEPEL